MSHRRIRLSITCALAALALLFLPNASRADVLAQTQVDIQGVSLTVDTTTATVQLGSTALIQTSFGGQTNDNAPVIPGALALGDLIGPGITTPITIATAPGHAFQVGGLTEVGTYYLQNVRLVKDGQLLQTATPSYAVIQVTNALQTKVTVRQLTPDELRQRGITVDPSNYDVYPRLVSYTDRQRRQQTFGYDDRGRLHTIFGPNGELDRIDYDSAGRVSTWTTPDSMLETLEFDLEGHPKWTRTTRYVPGTGLSSSKQVLDVFEQHHTWNAHGERVSWTMPRYNGFNASGWTDTVTEDHDAAGNVSSIARTLFGSTTSAPLMTASFRNAGRPDTRTVTTSGGASIVRKYDYDKTTGQMNECRVTVNDVTVAGSHIGYDGVQVSDIQLLGVSAEARHTRYGYDDKSRLTRAIYATGDALAAPETGRAGVVTLTPERDDFVSAATPTPRLDDATRKALAAKGIDTTAIDPPSTSATEVAGHKIGSFSRGTATRTYTYNNSELQDDGRLLYTFDEKGRLTAVTQKPETASTPIRRIHYYYDGNDRMIGRRAEYATPVSITADPNTYTWQLEDRAATLANDGLPAEVTFAWDAVSDNLVEVWRAGTATAANNDANGGLLKQIIHGGLQYDDPIETTFVLPGQQTLSRLYPIFDEAGSGSLQAALNAKGEVAARNVPGDPYGADDVDLAAAACDKIAVKATKDQSGTLQSVDVTVRSTEAINETTLAGGMRLATVDANGAVVKSATATPSLIDAHTAHFTLSGSDWTTLTSPANAVALSVSITSTLRAKAWSSDLPYLPPPDWAKATKSVTSTPSTPLELRESLASLTTWLSSVTTTDARTLYEIDALSLAGSAPQGGIGVLDQVAAARFQALPFSDPATNLVYVRNRWFNPETGTFLSPDPLGYVDSANLYAFAGGDPVNHRDPTGMQEAKGTPLEEEVEEEALAEAQEARGIDPLTGRPIRELREEEEREERMNEARGRAGLGRNRTVDRMTPEEQEAFIRNARRLRTDPAYRAQQEKLQRDFERMMLPRALREELERQEARLKRGPKPWPTGPHNITIAQRIAELQEELGPEWEHIGGGELKEEYIPTPEGLKSARRPDITFRNIRTGEYYRENVGKTDASNQPIRREKQALDDLEKYTGNRPGFTAYDQPKHR